MPCRRFDPGQTVVIVLADCHASSTHQPALGLTHWQVWISRAIRGRRILQAVHVARVIVARHRM